MVLVLKSISITDPILESFNQQFNYVLIHDYSGISKFEQSYCKLQLRDHIRSSISYELQLGGSNCSSTNSLIIKETEHSKEIYKREIESSKRVQKIRKKLNLFYYSEESNQYLYDLHF
jgi:hypothetical protein